MTTIKRPALGCDLFKQTQSKNLFAFGDQLSNTGKIIKTVDDSCLQVHGTQIEIQKDLSLREETTTMKPNDSIFQANLDLNRSLISHKQNQSFSKFQSTVESVFNRIRVPLEYEN